MNVNYIAISYMIIAILTIPLAATSGVEKGRGLLYLPCFLSFKNIQTPFIASADRPGTLGKTMQYAFCLS